MAGNKNNTVLQKYFHVFIVLFITKRLTAPIPFSVYKFIHKKLLTALLITIHHLSMTLLTEDG